MVHQIKAKPTASVDQAVTWVKNTEPSRVTDVVAYVREVWRLAEKVGYNPVVILAQAAYETAIDGKGPFESKAWIEDLNPAGIGITDGGKQNYRTYKNGIDAARTHIVHLGGYIEGPDGGWLKTTVYKYLDPRWSALAESGMFSSVKNVEDLGNGRWASQGEPTGEPKDTYANGILGYMKQIETTASCPPTPGTGTVDNPNYFSEDAKKLLPDLVWVGSPNYHARGYDPFGIIFHITDDDVLANTLSWFNDPTSDASSNFVIDRDGKTYQCVSTLNAPWTNGDVQEPDEYFGYVKEMRKRGGNFNNGSVTFETVCRKGESPTEAQYKTLIAWTKYLTHPDVYGKTIKRIRGFMGRHSNINSVGRPYCPGDETFDLARIIEAVDGDINDWG